MATKSNSVNYVDPYADEPQKAKVIDGDPADQDILTVELENGNQVQVAYGPDAMMGAARWTPID